jgi:hypothetical protein
MSAESDRLEEARAKNVPWRKRGPYLSERQWGTIGDHLREELVSRGLYLDLSAWGYEAFEVTPR